MKKGWEVKKLGEVCDIIGGGTPSKSNEAFYTGHIPWVTVRDMRSDSIVTTEYSITEAAVKNSSTNIILKNNVVIATRVGLGKVCLLAKDSAINQDLKGVVPKKGKEISNKFLFWWFKSVAHKIVQAGTGATVQGVKLPFIQSLPFPLISLSEQLEIVSILDEAFAAIDQAKENVQRNLQNAKELFQSELNSIFATQGEGLEEVKLSEVCEISSRLIDPKESKYQDLLHVGGGNIVSQKGTLINIKTAREEGLISGKFLFDDQMVLYSKIRPYLEKVVKCDFKGLCSADIYPLMPIMGKISQDFLYYLLLSKRFTDYAIAGSQRAGMPKVNRDHLFNYKFPLPSLDSQDKLIQKLLVISDESQKLEQLYTLKLNGLEELKKSILQKAFSGELTATKELEYDLERSI